MKTKTLVWLLIATTVGMALSIGSLVYGLIGLAREVDKAGGVKAVVDQVWCGDKGCKEPK